MTLRTIRLHPDPVLRVEATPVERFDSELSALVRDMIETMHAAPGVGLAAPQIGVSKQVAVVDLSVGEDPDALVVLVNPVIRSEEGSWSEIEGCLSIPGFSEKVDRPEVVTIDACGVSGEPFTLEAEEWLARACCHEIDHLHGILFVDHLRGLRREKARRFLKRLAKEMQEVSV